MKKIFMLAVLANEVEPEAIDDYVEEWHTLPSSAVLTLPEYLGMTDEEYSRWVKDPSVLHEIIEKRRSKRAVRKKYKRLSEQK